MEGGGNSIGCGAWVSPKEMGRNTEHITLAGTKVTVKPKVRNHLGLTLGGSYFQTTTFGIQKPNNKAHLGERD